ncbi:hypothetical protein LCDVSa077L [Lymphocystis disease virus 3]|uniref:Uncharacterized protein n=1 Tax=Lymphocystis disease virus 3 TaxID=2560566 RepID=A0A1B2RVZ4_9VIRU|nr:hypothetical protein BZK12_gp077 [Lymphocystis disease virus Sa]AOC55161.1 hypothetical protein LCDVSa077L [Lymphocystis disease virus 3]
MIVFYNFICIDACFYISAYKNRFNFLKTAIAIIYFKSGYSRNLHREYRPIFYERNIST